MTARTSNTLYVTTPKAFLAKDHENLVVRIEGEEKLRVPLHVIGSVVCFGGTAVSVSAMGELAQRGIGVSFLSGGGRFLARMEGPWQGGSLLRRDQYTAASDVQRSTRVARGFVLGKLVNSRRLLLRSARDASREEDSKALRKAADAMESTIQAASREDNLDRLRGREGEGARRYFGVFSHMIRNADGGFSLDGRQRRPPRDPMNALLSFLYAVLLHEVTSALLAVGLDPAVGFLHTDRPGRPGLGLDLMEEFRPALADRAALALINRNQIRSTGFTTDEAGSVRMGDATRRAVLSDWQERRRETLQHPFTGEEVSNGLLPHVQARLLARFLRGDMDDYPPFVIE